MQKIEKDDDMIVIIVGNENVKIKEEYLDQTDCTSTSQEPPKDMIIIKEEILDVPVEFDNEVLHEEFICDKVEEEYIVEEFDDVDENDELGEVDELDEIDEVDEVNEVEEAVTLESKEEKPKQQKRKTLHPSQRKSLVKQLRQQNPKLAKNKDLLISELVMMMRSVKPPPLPQDYYIMNGTMLECTLCSRLSETIPAAGRHYQEKHGSRYLICYACGADFKSTTVLYVHEKRCAAPDADVMLLARAVFLGNKGKQRPYLSQAKTYLPKIPGPARPPKRKFGCDICSAEFVSKNGLIAHLHLHNGLRPHRCHQCLRAYTSRSALSRHMKKHTDVKFVCDHCGRPFKEKGALVAHLETHQMVQKFACSECGRRFAQKYTMVRHFDRKHLNKPPPCACKLCPQRFRRTTLLKKHMKADHGLKLMTRKSMLSSQPIDSVKEGDNQIPRFTSQTMTAFDDSFGYSQDMDAYLNYQNICLNQIQDEPLTYSEKKTKQALKKKVVKRKTADIGLNSYVIRKVQKGKRLIKITISNLELNHESDEVAVQYVVEDNYDELLNATEGLIDRIVKKLGGVSY